MSFAETRQKQAFEKALISALNRVATSLESIDAKLENAPTVEELRARHYQLTHQAQVQDAINKMHAGG